MSENVELYLEALNAFNRRDKKAWLEVAHPELENNPPREWPEASALKGAEAVWDFYVEIFDTWEQKRLEIVGPIEEGNDTLVVELGAELQGKASGATVDWGYHQVLTFEGGKVVRIAWFSDRAEALGAGGLSEPSGDEPG